MAEVTLVRPGLAELPAYADALGRGWSPDNVRGRDAAEEQLAQIGIDAAAFTERLDDPEARGGPLKLPDGSWVPRLPGMIRWIWDGEFCGSIGLRWHAGTSALPDHVLGHIGFSVVPWKRGLGRATRALALLLPEAGRRGLDHVELTTDPGNTASQRVIQACGGRAVGRFSKPAAYGGVEAIRYRIDLT